MNKKRCMKMKGLHGYIKENKNHTITISFPFTKERTNDKYTNLEFFIKYFKIEVF